MEKKEPTNFYISLILKIGTFLSASIMVLGFFLLIFTPAKIPETIFSLPRLFAGLLNLNPYSFINLGILVLIFTPILRVVVAIISFSLEKDKKYIWISSGVLLILIGSIIFSAFKI